MMTERSYANSEGSRLKDYYCPSGFRFLTNIIYIDSERRVLKDATDFIRSCRKYYNSVAIGPAFFVDGSMMHDLVAIYVEKPISVKFGIVCHKCRRHYEVKDIVRVDTYFRDSIDVCKGCFSVYYFKEVVVGDETILISKYSSL